MTDESRNGSELGSLQEAIRPWKLLHYPVLASTSDRARQEVQEGHLQPPAVIVADEQSAGRGRGTNTWWSASGNVAATFVVSRNLNMASGLVPLLAGVGVRRALVGVTGCEDIALKWPNDLVVAEGKMAGLLCERLQRVDLIGVGVNVNAASSDAPPELRGRFASLREMTGRSWSLNDVLIAMAREIARVRSVESAHGVGELLREYERHHWPTGREVTLLDTDEDEHLTGRCQGVDAYGRLMLRTADGLRSCLTGTVVSVGPRIADPP
jgi:BirA family biotin operon repressor/biotin-[acetyl-CoA-carboxylase] ligase